ncbi:uncharacterized protein LOC126772272 isoform X1 [Nymphalis io]|uniref:uncharacterized protein LOC126772272 isoform X1 n=1 Tax=Inachis io TaxID=171585 RepID=UPI0021674488|nr:uncharacterized protein LOC126772272 isoform X1 [Nymphalis io]
MFPFLVVVFVTVVACQANLAVNQPVVCGPMPKEVYSCLGAPKVVKLEVARQCEKDLSECERMTCLFNKSGWMKADGIDKEKLSAHFDQLAKDYPEWEPAVQSAKAMCLTDDLPAQGIHLNCPAYDAMTCSFASFIKNTQPSQWSLLPECTSSRQFAAACPVCPSDCFAPVVPIGSCNACQSLQRSP